MEIGDNAVAVFTPMAEDFSSLPQVQEWCKWVVGLLQVGVLLARCGGGRKMRVFAREWCVEGISLGGWVGGQ